MMESVEDRLQKLREERTAREKARIAKLRELNLKKYSKNEPTGNSKPFISNLSLISIKPTKTDKPNFVRSNTQLSGPSKRAISAPVAKTNAKSVNEKAGPSSNGQNDAKTKARPKSNELTKTSADKTDKPKGWVTKTVKAINMSNKLVNNDIVVGNTDKNGEPSTQKPASSLDLQLERLKAIVTARKSVVPEKKTQGVIVSSGNDQKIETMSSVSDRKEETDGPKSERANEKTTKASHAVNGVPVRNAIAPVRNATSNAKNFINANKSMNNIKATLKDVRNIKSDIPNARNTKTANAKPDYKLARKSLAPPQKKETKTDLISKTMPRKSLAPETLTQGATKANPNRQSVFERLYQPKIVTKKQTDNVAKLKTDPEYLKKIIKDSGLILNRRRTMFEPQKLTGQQVRRSISAVHFKRIAKTEINQCIHKWSSVGEKMDKLHLKDEDDAIKEDKVVSAVKSERKKVKFQTPMHFKFNMPKPEEMQAKLHSWLQRRGKSMDSYHHLQCFGIHLSQKQIKPLNLTKIDKSETKKDECDKIDSIDANVNLDRANGNSEEVVDPTGGIGNHNHVYDDVNDLFDEEDKENVPLESDSDNDSYIDNMNNRNNDLEDLNVRNDFGSDIAQTKWRRASYMMDSFNETQNTTLTSTETVHHVDELLLGALNDLNELLRDGFDWEQCARWLRAIRERFPSAPDSAAYWECRAALEERRGDLPASVQCWEEAIAKGTERSVVEANLDQLLDKFMQLKISPNSGKRKQPDPKMVDIKNVFKSTLIRFAVQQAKLRQSAQSSPPKYTVTPVRRSARLSAHWSGKRTPLQVCTTVKQAGLLGHPVVFVPNDKLCETP